MTVLYIIVGIQAIAVIAGFVIATRAILDLRRTRRQPWRLVKSDAIVTAEKSAGDNSI
jgi:hypothetical protein